MVPKGPPLGYKPLVLVNDLLFEHRIHYPLSHDKYVLGLNLMETSFGEAAYQLAHELCQIYCDPRVTNWAIEILSHVAPLYILDILTQKWEEELPVGFQEESFDVFHSYKNQIMREAYHKIDLVQHQLSNNWIKKEVRHIHDHPELGNHVIYNVFAFELLSYFEDHPEAWAILPYVGKSSQPAPDGIEMDLDDIVTTKPDLDMLLNSVPDELKPAADEIISRLWVESEA